MHGRDVSKKSKHKAITQDYSENAQQDQLQQIQDCPSTSENKTSNQTQSKSQKPKIVGCKDCASNGKCIPFQEPEIEKVLCSKNSNGQLYYRLKFTDKSQPSSWFFPCKIPSRLIREFHINRTASGKKRKRKLQDHQHKFLIQLM